MSERELLLQFIVSLTLCEHMGDVADNVNFILKKFDMPIEWEDWPDLADALHEKGITTLFGTSPGLDGINDE